MRVLITGVTGFIGRRLAEVLDEGGHEVWGLSRNPDQAKQRVPQLTEAFAWNPVAQLPPGDGENECLELLDREGGDLLLHEAFDVEPGLERLFQGHHLLR